MSIVRRAAFAVVDGTTKWSSTRVLDDKVNTNKAECLSDKVCLTESRSEEYMEKSTTTRKMKLPTTVEKSLSGDREVLREVTWLV